MSISIRITGALLYFLALISTSAAHASNTNATAQRSLLKRIKDRFNCSRLDTKIAELKQQIAEGKKEREKLESELNKKSGLYGIKTLAMNNLSAVLDEPIEPKNSEDLKTLHDKFFTKDGDYTEKSTDIISSGDTDKKMALLAIKTLFYPRSVGINFNQDKIFPQLYENVHGEAPTEEFTKSYSAFKTVANDVCWKKYAFLLHDMFLTYPHILLSSAPFSERKDKDNGMDTDPSKTSTFKNLLSRIGKFFKFNCRKKEKEIVDLTKKLEKINNGNAKLNNRINNSNYHSSYPFFNDSSAPFFNDSSAPFFDENDGPNKCHILGPKNAVSVADHFDGKEPKTLKEILEKDGVKCSGENMLSLDDFNKTLCAFDVSATGSLNDQKNAVIFKHLLISPKDSKDLRIMLEAFDRLQIKNEAYFPWFLKTIRKFKEELLDKYAKESKERSNAWMQPYFEKKD